LFYIYVLAYRYIYIFPGTSQSTWTWIVCEIEKEEYIFIFNFCDVLIYQKRRLWVPRTGKRDHMHRSPFMSAWEAATPATKDKECCHRNQQSPAHNTTTRNGYIMPSEVHWQHTTMQQGLTSTLLPTPLHRSFFCWNMKQLHVRPTIRQGTYVHSSILFFKQSNVLVNKRRGMT